MSFSVHSVSTRQAFQKNIIAGIATYWEIAPGIEFCLRREPHSVGLALQVQSQALGLNQIQRALERRFAHPSDFAQLFLFLDPQRALVVWQALPEPPISSQMLNEIQSRQLSLLGLEDLDDYSVTY
ncbi:MULTISPECIES: transcriptional regulator [Pseudomonas]|uniref:Type III secretion system negative regulatory protein RspV n=1 Tax=Pseudomonas tehranensis TaxID=2745502 RepID=A0ABR6UMR0_9PSED|nr:MULTISPECIES: transcriptional regulator [Pseudomonas]MBC3345613.1 hypothetical protein [Pseudomonas tehranensis]SEN83685.1 hypothetical protein SAMN03159293_01025 [Pseudomonas sp. NFACC39-1]